MRLLVERGWSPSAAAAALLAGTAPAIDLGSVEPALEGARRANGIEGEPDTERSLALRTAFVDAAAALDSAAVEGVLDEMFAAGSYETVVERDILPALVALGDAWAAGRVDVAGEHAASHAVGRRLAGAYQAAGRATAEVGPVLVGLPPGARHELGALAFAVAARRAGLPVLYLGPDLPIADWVGTARRTNARAAVIVSVARTDGDRALAVARALAEARPGIVIGLGGRGSRDPGPPDTWPVPAPLGLPEHIVDAVGELTAAIDASLR
jgi:methanogenic corrinoid protein MtbC1